LPKTSKIRKNIGGKLGRKKGGPFGSYYPSYGSIPNWKISEGACVFNFWGWGSVIS